MTNELDLDLLYCEHCGTCCGSDPAGTECPGCGLEAAGGADAFDLRQRVAQLYADRQSPQAREGLLRSLAASTGLSLFEVRVQAHRDSRVLRGGL